MPYLCLKSDIAMKHVTIKDLASRLHLSTSTVSRALTDDKNIRRETREQVLALAAELGYKRNEVALGLKRGRTNTVGIIVPEMVTPFGAEVIGSIQKVLFEQGLRVIITQSDENPATERENLHLMEQFRVDGIIIDLCHNRENEDEYRRIQEEGTPVVFYDRVPEAADVTKVVVDDYIQSFFLVEHLIRSGRKRIIHLEAPPYITNGYERKRGYRDALEKFRIPYDPALVIKAGLSIADGRHAAERLLRDGLSFDALFAFTDTLAIGAMNYFQEQGILVPQEVAVAGFSGTVLSTIVYPQLTTVEQPLAVMGQTAAELMMEKILHPQTPPKTITLKAELKIRRSTDVHRS